MFPPSEHAELAYSVIPEIGTLDAATRAETQAAFAGSLREVWVVMCVLSGVGLGSVVVIKEFSLRKTTDVRWGLKEKKGGDVEEVREGEGDGEKSVGSEGGEVELRKSGVGEVGEVREREVGEEIKS